MKKFNISMLSVWGAFTICCVLGCSFGAQPNWFICFAPLGFYVIYRHIYGMVGYESISAIIEKWLWTIALILDVVSCIAGDSNPKWIFVFMPQLAILIHFSFKVFTFNNDDD